MQMSTDRNLFLDLIQAVRRFDHIDRLLRYMAQETRLHLAADGATVLLLDAGGSELVYHVGSFQDAAVERRLGRVRFPADKGAAGEICRTGRPLLVHDYPRSTFRFHRIDEQLRYDTHTLIGAPLFAHGAVMGVFLLVNKTDGPFTEKDSTVVQTAADFMAMAISHDRVSRALFHARTHIEALNRAKEEAIVHLSHELKTPLAVLDASLKLLSRASAACPSADQKEAHGRATRSLERLLEMAYAVEDILRSSDDVTFDAMVQLPQAPLPTAEMPNDDAFFQQVNIEFLIHELKDPLSVIETNTQMLADSDDAHRMSTQRRAGTLKRILRGTQKVRALLEALLEVGRAEAVCFNCNAFAPVDLVSQVLLEMVEAHAPDVYEQIKGGTDKEKQIAQLALRGIRIEAQPAAASTMMVQDETKVRQVVANLIKNALSYRRNIMLLNMTLQRGKFVLAVRDDGPGIASEHVEKIFERYKQVSPWPGVVRHGHGLGLAVSRILARSMDGDIKVDSQLGQGALFQLILPLAFDGTAD